MKPEFEPSQILRNHPDGVVIMDRDTRYVYFDAVAERMSGVPASQVLGRRMDEVFADIHESGEMHYFEEALKGRGGLSPSREFRLPSGKTAVLEASYAPYRDGKGEIVGVLVVVRELSGRSDRVVQLLDVTKSLSSAATQEEIVEIIVRKAVSATGAASGSIAILHPDKEMLETVQTLGYPEFSIAAFRYIPMKSHLPLTQAVAEMRPVVVHDIKECHEKFPDIAPMVEAGGYQALVALPLIIEGEVIGSMVLNFRRTKRFLKEECDFLVTLAGQCAHAYERSRLYGREKRGRAAAEAASAAKTRFLANVSHEIRTPLTAIMGFAELLQKPRKDEQRLSFLQGIIRNCNSLMNIVDDILDISKIESGRLRIVKEPVAIANLVFEVLSIGKHLASTKDIHLGYDVDDEVPELVTTDPNRLKQVLLNVLSNAIKFTEAGRVMIRVNLLKRGGNGNRMIAFRIEDTGVGIGFEDQRFLFEPFTQGKSKSALRYGGSGLGLAFSKRLAGALGGDIELLSSAPGKGSVFLATIPLEEVEIGAEREKAVEPAPHPREGRRLEGAKILIAEDQGDILEMLGVLLTGEGAVVTAVENGALAVDCTHNRLYDLILMDLQMPVLDGYEATEKIRAEGYKGPIFALSAHALDEHKKRSMSAGFNDHITKPVESASLIEHLEKALGRA